MIITFPSAEAAEAFQELVDDGVIDVAIENFALRCQDDIDRAFYSDCGGEG